MSPYPYVGPDHILERVAGQPEGARVDTLAALRRWLDEADGAPRGTLTATFVVGCDGALRLADRHSEHVACAGGDPVLSAGEITLRWSGGNVAVEGVTNQSTGFCPEPDSWPHLADAFDAIGVEAPAWWTAAFTFRRCPSCGQRNVVKDEWFVCAVCDGPLPRNWNFGA